MSLAGHFIDQPLKFILCLNKRRRIYPFLYQKKRKEKKAKKKKKKYLGYRTEVDDDVICGRRDNHVDAVVYII